MGVEPKAILPLTGLGLGLNTRDPRTRLPIGAARRADDVWFDRGTLTNVDFGYKRVTNTRLNKSVPLLDGQTQYFRVEAEAAGAPFAMTTAAYCMEWFFRPDSLRNLQYIANRPGSSFSTTDWSISLAQTAGALTIVVVFTGSLGTATLTFTVDADGAAIKPNEEYHLAVNKSGGTWTGWLWALPSTTNSSVTTTPGAFGTQNDNAKDLFIGVRRATSPTTDLDYGTGFFGGLLQEFRVWDVARAVGTITGARQQQAGGTANLQYYLKFTDTGPISFSNSGLTAGFPAVMEPRYATWTSRGLDFDGRNDMVVHRDSYLYREPVPDSDKKYPAYAVYVLPYKVTPDKEQEQGTIDQYVHTIKGPLTTNVVPVSTNAVGTSPLNGQITSITVSRGQWLLETTEDKNNPGQYQFRFVLWTLDAGTYRAYAVSSAIVGGYVPGVEYALACVIDQTNLRIRMYVNGTLANTVTIAGTMVDTENDPENASVKYWKVLGRAISQSRMGNNNDADPNDVDVKYAFDRSFDGKLDEVSIIANPLDEAYTAKFLATNTLTRKNVASLGAAVLSYWAFTEGAGPVAEDIGQQNLNTSFQYDTGFTRGLSLITTTEKSRLFAIVDHRYRSSTGEVRKKIAVHEGGVAEIDETTKTLVHLADGFRNDAGNIVDVVRYRDSSLLFSGSGPNVELYKDQLFRQNIPPPTGYIPVGLDDQVEDGAALAAGTYLYVFTFFSQFTGKRSAVGAQVTVRVRRNKANVVIGTDAEIMQTYAKTPVRSNKAPYDISGKKAYLRVTAWIEDGVSGAPEDGPTTQDPAYDKVKFTTLSGTQNPAIKDKEDVKLSECKTLIEQKCGRVFVDTFPDDTFEILSRFAGAKAHLMLDNIGSGENLVNAGGILFENVDATVYDGTGTTGHGIGLPTSSNPEVTHLEVWRTLADGTDLRLLARLPNGTQTFKDALPDELNIGEILDRSAGQVPDVRFAVPMGNGRIGYFGDPFQPQRLYYSEVNEPFNVPLGNTLDILDGRTLPITMMVGSEENTLLTKDDETFVLVPQSSAVFPFQIYPRMRDGGGSSRFGCQTIGGLSVYPDTESGFISYDGSRHIPIGRVIRPEWTALENKPNVLSAHLRGKEFVVFAGASGATLINGVMVNDVAFPFFYNQGRGGDGQVYGWSKKLNIPMQCVGLMADDDENDRIWFADALGFVYEFGSGQYSGNWDGSAVLTAPNASPVAGTNDATHVTLVQASLANVPEGYVGLPVTLVRAADASRETRFVIADTLAASSVCEIDHAWTGAFPVVGVDTVIIGSMESRWWSGNLTLGDPLEAHLLQAIHVQATAQAVPETVRIGVMAENGKPTEPTAATYVTLSNQESDYLFDLQNIADGRGNLLFVEALGVAKAFEIDRIALSFQPRRYAGSPGP